MKSHFPTSLWMTVSIAAILHGCASYEPQPLDPSAAMRQLEDRTTVVTERDNPTNSIGLTLAEGETVALLYNPALRIARLEAGVAKATAEHAGLWSDPVTGINFNDVSQVASPGSTLGGQIALTIPISGRLEAETDRANASLFAALATVQSSEWTTRIALRRAFAVWTNTRLRIDTVAQTVAVITQIAGIVHRMEQVGEMPRVEARLFQLEVAIAQAQSNQLTGQLFEREVEIKSILGLAPWAAIALAPAIMPSWESLDLATLRKEMTARSPLIEALRAEYAVAEASLNVEIRKQYPDIEVGPAYNTDGTNDFTVGVTLPLPLWNRNRQGVATAKAERELMRVRFDATIELQLADLESASAVCQRTAKQRTALERDIAPLAAQQSEEVQNIARLGEVNTLLLLESLKRTQEAQLSLIDAREAEWIAMIHLEGLIGPAPRNEVAHAR
ncbi:MAG: TolC family protein [Planctomycetota bacterium]|nr:TolC family protein [Planctomycetota bacterium]